MAHDPPLPTEDDDARTGDEDDEEERDGDFSEENAEGEVGSAGGDDGTDHDHGEEQMSEAERLEHQLHELETFELKEKAVRDEDDPSGKVAYRACCERLDKGGQFFRFPIDSVVDKFENAVVLDLSHCGLGDKGAEALASALRVNHSIHSVILTDNHITPTGARFLIEELMPNKTIRRVDFSKNKLGNRAASLATTTSVGTLLGRLLQRNSTILELVLRDNGIGDFDVARISEGIVDNASLLLLDLSHNDIGPNGGAAVAAVLRQNAELRELLLEWNRLGAKGSLAVLDGLERNNTVKRFNLAWNGVDDAGGELLGRIIAGSSALEEIDVSHNRIGVRGAEAIAKGVAGCGSLLKLNLSENPIRDQGCAAIARALREPNSLQLVNLSSQTEVGKRAMEEIAATRREKPKIDIIPPPSVFDPQTWG